MANDVETVDTVFSAGQNEGIDKAVLPLPNLLLVGNCRMRKGGRIGKRFGYSALPAVSSSGAALGSAPTGGTVGNMRGVAGNCCVVDDRAYVFDSVAGTWVQPVRPGVADTDKSRIPGVVSGWVPDFMYSPIQPKSSESLSVTECASAYFGGYVWYAVGCVDVSGEPLIRVVATDPVTRDQVKVQDFAAAILGNGGLRYPRLAVCGATLVLAYVSQPTAGTPTIQARNLTTLTGGFSAETQLDSGFPFTDGSGQQNKLGFDVQPDTGNAARFLYVASFNTAAAHVKVFTAATLVAAFSATFTDALPTIYGTTIGSTSNGSIFVAYVASNGFVNPSSSVLRVNTYSSTLGVVAAAVTVDALLTAANFAVMAATDTTPSMVPATASTVRLSWRRYTGVTLPAVDTMLSWVDIASSGAFGIILDQHGVHPLTRAFARGGRFYIWVTVSPQSGSVYGAYPALLRLTDPVEQGVPSGRISVSCPIEMMLQDLTVPNSNGLASFFNFDQLGLSTGTTLGGDLGSMGFFPITRFAQKSNWVGSGLLSSTGFGSDFRALFIHHYSESVATRCAAMLPVFGATLALGGAVQRIDAGGAQEVGFATSPNINSIATSTPGGSLTPSSSYQYVAYYQSSDRQSRLERSAPCDPAVIATGAGASPKVTLGILPIAFTARNSVQVRIYRTLANGTVFYFVGSIEGNIGGTTTFVDTLSDANASKNEVLYTQVGNTLPNFAPPACRFGVVGGNRVWLGGLLRENVIHCSKLILGDQVPSWADSDAFRVVFPAAVTGIAWMDNLVVFTAEGIYVVGGDGPDDSGANGEFTPATRLPFALGCINAKSIITVDDGTYFQTARGIYLLPRGFGAPIAVGDAVMDTLAAVPLITGAAALTKSTEQTITWSCVDSSAANSGQNLVYDLAHKVWSADGYTDAAGFGAPTCGIATWYTGELLLMGKSQAIGNPLRLTSSSYTDNGSDVTQFIFTGDLRPFGNMSHGTIQRLGLLVAAHAACTLTVSRASDWTDDLNTNSATVATKIFDIAAPNYPGKLYYLEVELGNPELRDVTKLSLQLTVDSGSGSSQGLDFINMTAERGKPQGLRLSGVADRLS